MERTRELLTSAKTKYNTAINVMESVQSELKLKVVELEELSNVKSTKYQKYEQDVRGGVYGGCGALTVGMIIADALGCLGKKFKNIHSWYMHTKKTTFALTS